MKLTKFIILFLFLGTIISCTRKETEERPNILFIMSDDHATNAISAYGSRLNKVNKTPNIDRLAEEGILLENCFSTNSICTPSRASILTGQYSHVNKVRTLKTNFNPESNHIGHILQKEGYQTAMIGKWHLHSEPNGFDFWWVLPGQGLYFDPDFKVKGLDETTDYDNRKVKTIKGYVTDIITDVSLNWLDKRDTNKPFMLMMHHKAPHSLWEYNKKYEHLFDSIEIPEPVNLFEDKSHRAPEVTEKENNLMHLAKRMSGQVKVSSVHKYGQWPTGNLDISGMNDEEIIKATYQKYLKDYLRVIASVDESVGRVLDYLEEYGLAENTIVIYTSDQGMFLGEHQYLDKRWIFEESIRMPFLMRWPKQIKAGNRMKELVANVDIAPTLLDLTGTKIPTTIQGNSFYSVLKGESSDWQKSIYYRYWIQRETTPAHFGIRTERYKLIFYYGLNLDTQSYGHPDSEPAWELYDLEKDPLEMKNVYHHPEYENIREELKIQLEEKRQEVGDTDEKYPKVLKRYKMKQ